MKNYYRFFLSLTVFFLTSFGILHAQSIQVNGTVVDSTGSPIPGVNITVQNTQTGTTTDGAGKYSLTVPGRNSTLVFSFVGFKTKNEPVNGRRTINVTLLSKTSQLSKLVVVGYGTQQKKDLTGSVSQVSGESLSKIPTSSALDALQGKAAGLQITPANGSPNSQPVVRIRGVGTLNNASPLFVVDGLLTNDISYISPDNIQSVSVLKDASATAIYGSRGANGVIVITTKHGQKGKTQLSASSYFGFQRVNNKIDLANARQFATLANESATNTGNDPVFDNPNQFGAGTDYQDLIFDDQAPVQKYQLSASGGNDNLVFDVIGNYFRQDGVVRGSNFERLSLRLNNQYFLTDHVTFGHNIAFNYNDSDQQANDLVNAALRADPTLPPFTPDGNFNNLGQNGGSANPAAAIAFNNNHTFNYRTAGNAFLQIDFLKHFDFKTSFSLDLRRGENKVFVPIFNVSPIQQNQRNSLNVNQTTNTTYIIKNTLNYQNTWGGSQLKLLGGITYQKFRFENLGGGRINFPGSDPAFFFLNAGEKSGETNTNGSNAAGIASYLARANYIFKDRYLLTGTFRIDGSSRFGSNNRYGYFPSVAAGWRISQEPFFNVPTISHLKLRASYGRVGNDKINSNAAIPLVSNGLTAVFGQNQQVVPGATITDLANPDLKYEVVSDYDIAAEIGFLDDRVNAEVEYYHRATNDILVRVPIPAQVGAGAPVVNAASVLNRGFDVNINWQENRGNFTYQIGLVGSTIHNEVTALGANQGDILGGRENNLGFTTRTAVGHPIGAFFGYKSLGVLQTQQEVDNSPTLPGQQPGDLKLADTNGDGKITPADRTFLGSPIPDYTVGLNLSAGYKDFDLSFTIDGQFGNQILNARRSLRGFRLLNYSAEFLNRFHGPGTSNSEPRVTEGSNFQVAQFLQNGDFLRLRNIQLGFTLPVGVASALNVRKLRIYFNASNPLTITNYTGYSPQVANFAQQGSDAANTTVGNEPVGNVLANGIDNGVFPVASSYTLGVKLDF